MVNSSKVKVSGPGLGSSVRNNVPQTFTVDCQKAGVAPLAVSVNSKDGAEPVEVTDNGDGTHTVSYTPSVEGPYSVAVKYAEEDIPRRYRAVLQYFALLLLGILSVIVYLMWSWSFNDPVLFNI